MKKFIFALLVIACCSITSYSQNLYNNPNIKKSNIFEQRGGIFLTPDEYRTASGAPRTKYWQQR